MKIIFKIVLKRENFSELSFVGENSFENISGNEDLFVGRSASIGKNKQTNKQTNKRRAVGEECCKGVVMKLENTTEGEREKKNI